MQSDDSKLREYRLKIAIRNHGGRIGHPYPPLPIHFKLPVAKPPVAHPANRQDITLEQWVAAQQRLRLAPFKDLVRHEPVVHANADYVFVQHCDSNELHQVRQFSRQSFLQLYAGGWLHSPCYTDVRAFVNHVVSDCSKPTLVLCDEQSQFFWQHVDEAHVDVFLDTDDDQFSERGYHRIVWHTLASCDRPSRVGEHKHKHKMAERWWICPAVLDGSSALLCQGLEFLNIFSFTRALRTSECYPHGLLKLASLLDRRVLPARITVQVHTCIVTPHSFETAVANSDAPSIASLAKKKEFFNDPRKVYCKVLACSGLEVVHKLPGTPPQHAREWVKGTPICPVCSEGIPKAAVVVTRCWHTLCLGCYTAVVNHSKKKSERPRCPTCRDEFMLDDKPRGRSDNTDAVAPVIWDATRSFFYVDDYVEGAGKKSRKQRIEYSKKQALDHLLGGNSCSNVDVIDVDAATVHFSSFPMHGKHDVTAVPVGHWVVWCPEAFERVVAALQSSQALCGHPNTISLTLLQWPQEADAFHAGLQRCKEQTPFVQWLEGERDTGGA